ncbi:MAG: FliI/YscN family ATPase [Bacteriovoracaceae bacterium]|nr:FliI/YscN family ATPase [Bacteriovoracaceae bacterium]
MAGAELDFTPLVKAFESNVPYLKIGKVKAGRGVLYEVSLPKAIIGSSVEFVTEFGDRCFGEIVSIRGKNCMAVPYQELPGINSETKVILQEQTSYIACGDNYLGRVIDFQGRPLDNLGPINGPFEKRSIYGAPINPLDRPPIEKILTTGVNAIDCFTALGQGQRMAIMAGSGVGKSVLLGMIAQHTSAEVNVIALVGERGREVLEFIKQDLGEEGLRRSGVVVATSDNSSIVKLKAAYVATTIAEYFRDQGKTVLFMMDSITRFAMAGREIGLGAGEPPGQRGYPPSVFASLPKLMERVGTKEGVGNITGIYTVLVEGGDMDEPIADAIRAISDGHIILSRELAAKNHFPAIDILASLSRVMNKVVSKEQRIVVGHLRNLLASYKEMEDLINVGAYVKGSSPNVDKALVIYPDLMNLLRQDQNIGTSLSLDELFDQMVEMAKKAEDAVNPPATEAKAS